jgi:hypothetical protein
MTINKDVLDITLLLTMIAIMTLIILAMEGVI